MSRVLLGADHDAVRHPEPMPGSVRPVQVGGSPIGVELAVAGEASLGEAWPDAVAVEIQGHRAMDREIEGAPGGELDVAQHEELTDAL